VESTKNQTLKEDRIESLRCLIMITAFESEWHPDMIFEDKQPRKLHGLFDDEASELARRAF